MTMKSSKQRFSAPGIRRLGLACMLMLVPGWALAQSVLWEDYRGLDSVVGDGDYIGPPGAPKFDNYPGNAAMPLLRSIAADPDNAARTGSSADINFRQNPRDQTALCDAAAGTGWENSQACLYQAQGRVLYALVSFPQAGTYTLSAAHDDNLAVELSTDYANTNYRAASYDIPVGALASYTSSDTVFETIGTFSAANANSCALIRVYWLNQGGVNHTRLRWTRPGGVTEIVPASAFRDPSLPTSANGCNGSITGNGTAITLNKVLGSPRLDASDQFTLEIGTSAAGGTVRSATTAGSGTGQQASTGAYAASTGTTYYLREVMAPGSASALAGYEATIACTRNGVAYAPSQEGPPANRRWRVNPAANDQIVCTITNTAPMADLSVTKTNHADSVVKGSQVTYDITVHNDGPDAANDAVLTDPAPTRLQDCALATPACTASGGASCPAVGSAAGQLSIANLQGAGVVLPVMPNGGGIVVKVQCTVQ
jgi:uncharacterized repeat protein (TIGR01451 family)